MAEISRGTWLSLAIACFFLGYLQAPINAQIPTKTPPTPVPSSATSSAEALQTRSRWHEAVERGHLQVGMLYNEEPFGWLDIRGNVTGYDADILRSVVELWDLEIQFSQITRHTGTEMLQNGEVDLLAGGQILSVDDLDHYSFSHPYHRDSIQIWVRTDAPWQNPAELTGQSVGVLQVSVAQEFLRDWSQRANVAYVIRPQPTLDRGLRALLNGEIEALVGARADLELLPREPGQFRPLEEELGSLPLAFALPKHDSILRDAIGHALQTLAANGRLRELHSLYYPNIPHDDTLIPRWQDLGEEASFQPADTITHPQFFTIPRLRESGVLRAVLVNSSDATVQNLSSSLVSALGELWGITVEIRVLEGDSAIAALVAGEVDLAVGIKPIWEDSPSADFTSPYLGYGTLLLTRAGDDIASFANLPSPAIIAIPNEDPAIFAHLRELAEGTDIELSSPRYVSTAFLINELLADDAVDAIYADGLRLMPLMLNQPNLLRLTDGPAGGKWFSRSYLSIATPENDVEFRNWVELSLQELVQNGEMAALLAPFRYPQLPEMTHQIQQWPGTRGALQISNP